MYRIRRGLHGYMQGTAKWSDAGSTAVVRSRDRYARVGKEALGETNDPFDEPG